MWLRPIVALLGLLLSATFVDAQDLSYLTKLPLYQEWIAAANARDAVLGEKQRTWIDRRPR